MASDYQKKPKTKNPNYPKPITIEVLRITNKLKLGKIVSDNEL